MKTRLISDPWNGGRWQWQYYDADMALWFDLGPSFPPTKDGEAEAEKWLEQYEKGEA